MQTVQIKQIIEDTGEKPRTIQYWTDYGILRAEVLSDRQGRGTHRTYRAEPWGGERTWAIVASALYRSRTPVAELKKWMDAMRLIHDPAALVDTSDPDYQGAMEVRKDTGDMFGDVIRFEKVWALLIAVGEDGFPMTAFDMRQVAYGNHPVGHITQFFANHPTTLVVNIWQLLQPLRQEITGQTDLREQVSLSRLAEEVEIAKKWGLL